MVNYHHLLKTFSSWWYGVGRDIGGDESHWFLFVSIRVCSREDIPNGYVTKCSFALQTLHSSAYLIFQRVKSTGLWGDKRLKDSSTLCSKAVLSLPFSCWLEQSCHRLLSYNTGNTVTSWVVCHVDDASLTYDPQTFQSAPARFQKFWN